ncbi:MAG: hypothetical protein JRC68_10105 [Deltaproteobacteria bacterium]|nr:hypothetical protein [Deltaproteobacteria bacterium]
MEYTIIEKATGVVIKKVGRPDFESLISTVKEGQIYIKGHAIDAKTQLYLDGVVNKSEAPAVINKATMIKTTEYTKITGLPEKAKIFVRGIESLFAYNLSDEDTEFEFSIDTEGTYSIECKSRVYLPIIFVVEVTS